MKNSSPGAAAQVKFEPTCVRKFSTFPQLLMQDNTTKVHLIMENGYVWVEPPLPIPRSGWILELAAA